MTTRIRMTLNLHARSNLSFTSIFLFIIVVVVIVDENQVIVCSWSKAECLPMRLPSVLIFLWAFHTVRYQSSNSLFYKGNPSCCHLILWVEILQTSFPLWFTQSSWKPIVEVYLKTISSQAFSQNKFARRRVFTHSKGVTRSRWLHSMPYIIGVDNSSAWPRQFRAGCQSKNNEVGSLLDLYWNLKNIQVATLSQYWILSI